MSVRMAASTGRAVVGGWLIGFAILIWLVALQTRYVADLPSFLPKPESPAEALMIAQLADGIASRLVLIGLEGAQSEDVIAASKAMAPALRASGGFRFVANGERFLGGGTEERLFDWRYHMSAAVTPDRFTVAGLRGALEARLESLATPVGSFVRRWLPRDPTGEFLVQLSMHAERSQPPMQDGVWFDAPRGRALLMAEAMSSGFDMHEQERIQDLLHAAFKHVKGDQALSMVLAGPAVFARKSQQSIEGDAWWLTLVSTVLVFAVLTIAYRSPRLTLLAFLPVASGIVAAIGAVGLVFGSCHIITIGFGATLIGEAVDYPTYLFMQRRANEPMNMTARRIGPNLRLAVLTTVLGSAAMLASSFSGVAQLGLFTLAGVGVAGLVTRFVIPALAADARVRPVESAQHGARAVDRMIARMIGQLRRAAFLVPIILLASAAYLGARHASLWEHDLERLNPIAKEDKELDYQMRTAMNAPDIRYLVSVRADDTGQVLDRFEPLHRLLDRLVDEALLGRYDSPARYVPGASVQAQRLAALPPADVLTPRLRDALAGLPFKDDLFAPFLRDVATARAAPLMTPADLDGTPWRSALDALLVNVGGQWTGLAPLTAVRDAEAIERAVIALDDPAISFFDLKRESDAMLTTHGRRSVLIALFGLVIIAGVLMIGTRDHRRVVRIMLPVLTAMSTTAALLVLFGERITFLHVVSLLLVLGTGVNYALFFTGETLDAGERARTAHAIAVATFTTLCGFGVLVFAATPVLHTIGLTVVVGAALSFVFSAAWAARPPTVGDIAGPSA